MKRSYRKKRLFARLIHPSWIVRPLVVVLFLSGGLGLVWIRTQVRDVRYRLTELEWELKTAQDTQQELRVKKAVLSSPARIEKAARRVGLGLADRTRIFIVGNDPTTIPVSRSIDKPVLPRAPRS